MAGNLYHQPRPYANPFDIYTDSATPNRDLAPLPRGGCNYVDIGPGSIGTRCGCRKFWNRQTIRTPAPTSDPAGWCMCNHHACYHDDAGEQPQQQPQQQQPLPPPNALGQENQRPKTGREPLSPMLDIPMQVPPTVPGFPSFGVGGSAGPLSFINEYRGHASPAQPAPTPTPAPAPSLPDTMSMADLVQSQYERTAFPPIPAQCLLPSQTASTTSSSRAQYLRPFAGKGLHTLGGGPPGPPGPPYQPSRQGHPYAPTQRDLPDTAPNSILPQEQRPETPMTAFTTPAPPESRVVEREYMPREALKTLKDMVTGYGQRLDKLETGSFAGNAHDECSEKHEHFDLRITDLEGKIDELEKLANDVESRKGDRTDDATQSVASLASDATSRPTHSHELISQIESLKAQVSLLQSSLPSYSHAWEVEVVFLPFPLKKVWQDLNDFKSEPAVSNDDWTQLPMTMSNGISRSQSPMFGDWASPGHDAEWLLPKACGDKSVTDKRLRSRGLIKRVSVKGPDARSVQAAIHAEFANVFEEMRLLPRQHEHDPKIAKFHGLQSSWVPLRKIHKDSRLRFLSPAEMVTPALWDVPFLNAVMMRSSEPRLFVTHPDAYLQDYQAYHTGWTWQKVRELTRVYPDAAESSQVPEADALEEHWSWNDQLDEPPSANTSMSLRQQRRHSGSPALGQFPMIERWRSQSPVILRDRTPTFNGRRSSVPAHVRTSSVPAASRRPTPFDQRRVASYGYSRTSTPAMRAPISGGIMKNRRTRSPSHARFTPRWTGSPSPMAWAGQDRQPPRGTTPFAYATPHSNAAPIPENRGTRSGSVVRFDAQHQYFDPEDIAVDDEDDENDEDYDEQDAEFDDDGDVEIKIYESDSESNMDDVPMATDAQLNPQNYDSQGNRIHEDEPWPGIEDRAHESDSENIAPTLLAATADQGSQHSQQSSVPSEYPSTQRIWPGDTSGFLIHEDRT